jgi:uncharacterized protein (TIGR02646 family)
MINITSKIRLSKTSRKIIKSHIKLAGLTASSWDEINRFVKNEISYKLLAYHSPKCVYCERYFIQIENQIDHFVPKAKYPQYSFTCCNLFYSCQQCNKKLKGQESTIYGIAKKNYKQNFFNILHPYFHDIEKELIYQDVDKVNFNWGKCSDLAKFTIEFWKWDSEFSTYYRATILKNQKDNPIDNEMEKRLIEEIIAYRK